eukprot:5929473-Pyramimonas_sp.AAC.1
MQATSHQAPKTEALRRPYPRPFLGEASIVDVGAGVGQLKRYLQANPNNITDYQGFDASYNIHDFWGLPAPLVGAQWGVLR